MALPSTIPNLIQWLRASDLGGVDGDTVTTWADSSGTGNAVTQGTAARRPLLKTGILNGKAVVRFDSVDDWLRGTYVTPVANDHTVILVADYPATSNKFITDGIPGGNRQVVYRSSATNWQAVGSAAINYADGRTAPVPFVVVTTDFSSTAGIANIAVNGSFTTAVGNTGSTASTGITVGGSNGANSGGFFQGDIAEVLVFNRVLTLAEKATVHSYVQDTYGIAVSDYTAGGPSVPAGTSVGSTTTVGTASGSTVRSGSTTGTTTTTGSATGTAPAKGAAAGSTTTVGTASGSALPVGMATGSTTHTGVAAGTAPAIGGSEGTATGSTAHVGAATGSTTRAGSAAGAVLYVGTASGGAPAVGDASGTAVGQTVTVGTASGTSGSAGTAVGLTTITGTATGLTLTYGAATGLTAWAGTAAGSAFGITFTPTPSERRLTIPAELRRTLVPAENRRTEVSR